MGGRMTYKFHERPPHEMSYEAERGYDVNQRQERVKKERLCPARST